MRPFQIDHREDEIVKSTFKKLCPEAEICQLEVGDFVCGQYAIEHKSESDYWKSLYSGHLDEQIANMKQTFLQSAIVVSAPSSHILTRNNSIGYCASCCVRGVPVLIADNLYTAMNLTFRLLTKWNDGKDRSFEAVNKRVTRDPVINTLTGIPFVSQDMANRILEYYPTVSDLCLASISDLQTIKGIGPKIAQTIYKTLHTPKW